MQYNSKEGDAFIVHRPNKKMIFKPSEAGLYHYAVNNYDFLVDENRQGYSQRQYEQAKLAREVYHVIGNPSVEDFKKIIRTNGIKLCPVTTEDINAAVKCLDQV